MEDTEVSCTSFLGLLLTTHIVWYMTEAAIERCPNQVGVLPIVIKAKVLKCLAKFLKNTCEGASF